MASWGAITPQFVTNTNDTISCMSWSSDSTRLAFGSWDGTVGIVSISSGKTEVVWQEKIAGEFILSCAFGTDDRWVAFGGASGCIHIHAPLEVQAPHLLRFEAHSGPVSCLGYCAPKKTLVSASWDQKLRYWVSTTPPSFKMTASIGLPERAYCMDIKKTTCVVALGPTSATHLGVTSSVAVLEVGQGTILKLMVSPLKYQSKSISLFADAQGFLLGSIEGRCAIVHIHESTGDFIFKCHRNFTTQTIYAVNCIAVHPLGTFATAGGDGIFNYWDKSARIRLKAFPQLAAPITSACFSPSGHVFVYATGEDWQKGCPITPIQTSLWIQAVGVEIQPKKKP